MPPLIDQFGAEDQLAMPNIGLLKTQNIMM
jgi:hypothetical protein